MALQAAALYATVSVAGADKSVRELGKVDKAFNTTSAGVGGSAKKVLSGAGTLAGGLVRLGTIAATAVVGLGAAAVGIASSMQDAFAGVKKTVKDSPANLAALDAALQKLTTRIPVDYTDLAGMAQEAGALGVRAKDIASFTEAVARTVAATVGLDKNMASEAFGKIGTIFSLKGQDYNRLGSVLVELGNNAASTEADIVGVALRFAAAGSQAGLSTAKVLGWSSAIASLGPEAEAAGSALSRVFNRLSRNIGLMDLKTKVGTNAKARVDVFAAVSGMTTKQFVAAYTKDASAAMQGFLVGLSKMDKIKASRALFEAGIVNVRDINAVLLLAKRTDLLAKSVTDASKAWSDNTELVAVSEKRFDTFKAHLMETWSAVKLGANAFGKELLPALGRTLLKLKDFTLAHLPDLERMGKDVGKAIDDIDWARVEQGAGRILGIAQDFLGVLKQIPAEVLIVGGSFVALDKLSGTALSRGLGTVLSGLIGLTAGLGGALLRKVPGIGGAVSSLTATPVYVVNFPPGFGGVGPGGGALGAAEGGALGFFTSGLLGPGILIATAIATSVIASIGARGQVDQTIATGSDAELMAIAEAARKHGVSDENNAALNELLHRTVTPAAPPDEMRDYRESGNRAAPPGRGRLGRLGRVGPQDDHSYDAIESLRAHGPESRPPVIDMGAHIVPTVKLDASQVRDLRDNSAHLRRLAEEARKHGVSDENNAALKELTRQTTRDGDRTHDGIERLRGTFTNTTGTLHADLQAEKTAQRQIRDAANATTRAVQAVAVAIAVQAINAAVNVVVTPQPVALNVNGREVAKATVPYTAAQLAAVRFG